MNANEPTMPFDERLLNYLRCPVTHSKLRRDGDWLVAERSGLAYPIRDGIPVLLIEEARLPEGVKSIDELRSQMRIG